MVRVVDEFARAQRRERARAEVEELVVGVLWALWCVRVEFVLMLALVVVQRSGRRLVGEVGGVVVVALVVVSVLAVRPSREAVVRCCAR